LSAAHDVATSMVAHDALSDEPEWEDELRLFVDDDEADYLFKS